MKTLLLVLVLGLFISCQSASTKQEAPKKDTVHYDHADIAKVYGNINFGVNPNEYKKEITETLNKVGTYTYAFYPQFYRDSLYALNISSVSVYADEIDTRLVDYMENLKNVISQKYGTPEDYGHISILDLKPGLTLWKYSWEISNKKIKIGIQQNNSNYKYNTIMNIYDQNMVDKISSEEDKKQASQVTSSASKF